LERLERLICLGEGHALGERKPPGSIQQRALTSSTDFETSLITDENLENTDDLRIDWGVNISVALAGGLAFKTHQMLYDGDPPLVGVPLLDGPSGTEVLTPNRDIDRFVTLSLVTEP